ncbi:cation diffusion facilitator family transporter [Methanobrevibacter sp.]|uniref:cation diffusion facilitator family transporter n=1 Tax=Methanobrevibacter sp. TaxID=66852 RepID=UPI00388E3644
MNDELRENGGNKAIVVAVAANIFLTVFNLLVGFASGSSALISEGAHTFTDIVTTVAAYIGFKLSLKPADSEHPLGYGRAEAISGLFIVLFLVIIAWEILEKGFKQIYFHQAHPVTESLVVAMAFIGILVNFAVSTYLIRMGKKIQSPAIVADGQHQRTDIFSSVAILVGAVITNMGYPIFDPIISIVIGVLILKTAVKLFIANFNYIIGKVPSQDFILEIKNIALSIPQVHNPHDIKVDYMGNYAVVSLHVELDENLILRESHRIAHEVQDKILLEKPEVRYVIVHTCPLNSKYNHEQRMKS